MVPSWLVVVREREMMLAMLCLILTPKMVWSPYIQRTKRGNGRQVLPWGGAETSWLVSRGNGQSVF